LDRFDLFVRVIEFDLLFFRNDHVRNSNRDASFGRLAEAELLEFIKRLNRSFLTRHLVTTPDYVAQLLLARGPIEKTNVLRPNLIEEDPASGGLDHPYGLVAINGIAPEIGIFESNAIMRFDRVFRHRELDLDCIREQWQSRLAITARGTSRPLREVITADGEALPRGGGELASGGGEKDIARQHDHPFFQRRLDRQCHVYDH